jgi:HEAT repeat protein
MAQGEAPAPITVDREKRREENFEKIVQQLRHDHIPYRVKAAEALGRIGDKRGVEPLIPLLSDSSCDVQYVTARSLGDLRDERAVEPLIASLRDPERWVRQAAAWALGEIGDPRAVEPIIVLLTDRKKEVRVVAAEALGRIADRRALGRLGQIENEDEEWEVRSAARSAVRTISGDY